MGELVMIGKGVLRHRGTSGGAKIGKWLLVACLACCCASCFSITKQLKAAQEDLQANKLDEALVKVKKAERVAEKSAYDSYRIDMLLAQIYQKKQDMADVIPALQAAALTQYATPEQQKTWLTQVARYYFKQKDYPKALEAADQAIKHGVDDVDTHILIAKNQYLSGKYKEAAQSMRDAVKKQEKPDEESLKLLMDFDLKTGNDAGAFEDIKQLVRYYPNPEYSAHCDAKASQLGYQKCAP
jgi:tetratricopeptide (TPR) repeat protein